MTSVGGMRRIGPAGLVACAFLVFLPSHGASATTTTTPSVPTTTVPVLCPPATGGTPTTAPPVGCINPAVTTTTTAATTTTSLPVAVTTVPEGCALPPTAQAVFVGTVTSLDPVNAVFAVTQMRAGSLEGFVADDTVQVRYGSDAKYLDVGRTYIVGVEQDSVTLRLRSTLRDQPELFGGAEAAGTRTRCPRFEAAARTLNTDGSEIATGMFDTFFEEPWRVATAVLLPPALVLCALFALAWFRRGLRR